MVTLEQLKENSLKYHTYSEWLFQNPEDYLEAKANGWLEAIREYHSLTLEPNSGIKLNVPKVVFKQKPVLELNPFDERFDIKGDFDERVIHKPVKIKNYNMSTTETKTTETKKNRKWSLESCKADAAKYKSRSEWFKNSPSACLAARKNGWIDQCLPVKEKAVKAEKTTTTTDNTATPAPAATN